MINFSLKEFFIGINKRNTTLDKSIK